MDSLVTLFAEIRKGDAAAFDALYVACNPRLYRFVARLARQPALAEEIVQETWLRFAMHARTLPEDCDPVAWLFTVAKNLQRSQRRRETLHRAGLARVLRWFQGSTPSPSPYEHSAANEAQARLEHELTVLPEAQREILLLCAVERFTPAQAAKLLGISSETARKRLERARAQLQARLDACDWSWKPAGEPR